MLRLFRTSVFVSISNAVRTPEFIKLISLIVVTALSLYYVVNLK